jgi:hypothetical protein
LSFVMPLSATASVPFQVVEASSQKVVLNFPKFERTDAPINFSVVSKIHQIVHPNSVHVSNVSVTYNSSATPIESRVRSLDETSTSIRVSADSASNFHRCLYLLRPSWWCLWRGSDWRGDHLHW